MKIKTLKTVTISLGLLNAYTLFAQIENNLKAEGYKLEEMQSQITHNKKTALLLEDLFEKPYLQMDPNIVEGIQEGIEGLITREKPKTPSVKLPPITGPNTSFNETPTVRLDIQDSLPDTHEPKVTLPPLTRPNTDEAKYNILKEKNVTVQSPFQQTVQLNGTTSEQVVHLVQSQPPQEVSSERLQKTLLQIEADRTLIETWKAMEMKMKEKEKEAIDLAVENENEVINWNNAGQSFYNAAEKLEKAIEAERKGKTEIAIKWHEVVEQQVLSAEQYKQSAKAEIEGNKEDFNRFWKAAQEIEKKVNELTEEASMGPKSTENSSDEEESDSDYLMMNPSTVEGAEEAIRNFFIGERRFLPPAESTQLGDSEGEEINNTTVAIHSEEAATQENSRKEMALLVCCDKWLAETRCITKPNQILSDYLIDVIQRGANHKLVKDFEKYWSYVLKARELGDAPLALGWIQVAEDIQQAIEDNI
ncbi:MAG TPA: hypothetical protein VJK54_07690, partial [Chthoniobacterales bacterium]|nr:hypothetical protein [Chthoniobacterales bacterium]